MSNVFQQFGAGLTAFDAPVDARLAFIRRTYLHLAGAIGVFVALSAALYAAGAGEAIAQWAFTGRGGAWLLVLGAFALVGWLGRAMAHGARSPGSQYAGLAVYTVAEALIFAPLIWLAAYEASKRGLPSPLVPAAAITLVTFAGLSAIVLMSKRDFSFLGMFLKIGGFVALGLIVCGVIFGFNLGLWFSGAMILFACGAILYTTSRVLHQYRTDQHVGAALELFAAVALLFWYVLRILMQMNRRN